MCIYKNRLYDSGSFLTASQCYMFEKKTFVFYEYAFFKRFESQKT